MNIYSSEVTFNYVEDEDMKEDGIKLTMSSFVINTADSRQPAGVQ